MAANPFILPQGCCDSPKYLYRFFNKFDSSGKPLISPPKRFNALGYRRDDGGRIELAGTVAGFVGFIIFLVAFLVGSLLIRLFV